LKQLIVDNLALEISRPIKSRMMQIFRPGGIGLDSLDGVELVVVLHRRFGLDVKPCQKPAKYSAVSTRWLRTCWPMRPNNSTDRSRANWLKMTKSNDE